MMIPPELFRFSSFFLGLRIMIPPEFLICSTELVETGAASNAKVDSNKADKVIFCSFIVKDSFR